MVLKRDLIAQERLWTMLFRTGRCENDDVAIERVMMDAAADAAEYVSAQGGNYDAVEWSEDGIMLGDHQSAYHVITRDGTDAAVKTVWCDGYRVLILQSVIADQRVQIDNLAGDLENLRLEILG